MSTEEQTKIAGPDFIGADVLARLSLSAPSHEISFYGCQFNKQPLGHRTVWSHNGEMRVNSFSRHGVQKLMNLYKTIDVWKKVDKETAIRYRCFEALNSGGFCVQSADFYTLPPDANQVANLNRQFVDLFIQQDPAERSSEYSTLGEAIAAHDKAFETA